MKSWPRMVLDDKDPDRTRREILRVLNEAGCSMRRRKIQQEIFGDKWGAGHVATALLWLRERRLIERSYRDDRSYRITDAGRAALELDDLLREAS